MVIATLTFFRTRSSKLSNVWKSSDENWSPPGRSCRGSNDHNSHNKTIMHGNWLTIGSSLHDDVSYQWYLFETCQRRSFTERNPVKTVLDGVQAIMVSSYHGKAGYPYRVVLYSATAVNFCPGSSQDDGLSCGIRLTRYFLCRIEIRPAVMCGGTIWMVTGQVEGGMYER